MIRLNKAIAQSGMASRRKADELIVDGQVRVNGKTVTELGLRVDPRKDEIFVSNKRLKLQALREYYMFHKPTKVLTAMSDPEDRPTVKDYLDKRMPRLFPVGRLDWDTEGLLILTNDGDLAQRISHPKYEIPKTYIVKLNGQPTDGDFAKLLAGVTIIGGKARALHVSRMKSRGSYQYDWVKIIIDEGRNRQVRRMFEKIGFDVMKLQRVAVGSLKIGNLDKGKIRPLTKEDVERIFVKPRELREPDRKSYQSRPRPGGYKSRRPGKPFGKSSRKSTRR